jgi:hypothetical protein
VASPPAAGSPVAADAGFERVASASCVAYRFDSGQAKYVRAAEHAVAQVTRASDDPFHYRLSLKDAASGQTLTSTRIDLSINPNCFDRHEKLSLTFLSTAITTGFGAWGAKIPDAGDEKALIDAVGRAMAETARHESFSKIQDEDRHFLLSHFSDDEGDADDACGDGGRPTERNLTCGALARR